MNMVTKIRIDQYALLAMSRQDAVAYYMREAGATEEEAVQLVSSTHPVFKDVVRPAEAHPTMQAKGSRYRPRTLGAHR